MTHMTHTSIAARTSHDVHSRHVINDQDIVTRQLKLLRYYKRHGNRVIINASGDLVVRPSFLEFSLLQVCHAVLMRRSASENTAQRVQWYGRWPCRQDHLVPHLPPTCIACVSCSGAHSIRPRPLCGDTRSIFRRLQRTACCTECAAAPHRAWLACCRTPSEAPWSST